MSIAFCNITCGNTWITDKRMLKLAISLFEIFSIFLWTESPQINFIIKTFKSFTVNTIQIKILMHYNSSCRWRINTFQLRDHLYLRIRKCPTIISGIKSASALLLTICWIDFLIEIDKISHEESVWIMVFSTLAHHPIHIVHPYHVLYKLPHLFSQ